MFLLKSCKLVYGYIERGISQIQTKANFGEIRFSNFFYPDYFWEFESNEDKSLAVEEEGFDVSVSINNCYVKLQDKEKESRINQLIAEDVKTMIRNLQNLDKTSDISISGGVTYETPEIISITYGLSGTIDDEIVEEYATTIIDINQSKRLRLTDIIDSDRLYDNIISNGFYEDVRWDDSIAKNNFFEMSKEQCKQLLDSSDDIQVVFSNKEEQVFCSVYEKSLCLYFRPQYDRSALGYDNSFHLYISLENILSDVKTNYWDIPEEYVTHVEWIG